MEWTNEKIIEFLKAFQKESVLWDSRHTSYKNRHTQGMAWHRILQSLSFPATINDLKKKKESLMCYYRIHINKYKKSIQSGSETSDTYTTSWFAFDIMHSFLGPIYASDMDITFNTESFSLTESSHHASLITKSEASEGSGSMSPDENIRPSSSRSNYNQSTGFQFVTKNLPVEITAPQKQIDEAFDPLTSHPNKKGIQDYDEYDHFAHMIAAKIRKIKDFEEREIVMNAIQNLVFQSLMKYKNKNSTS